MLLKLNDNFKPVASDFQNYAKCVKNEDQIERSDIKPVLWCLFNVSSKKLWLEPVQTVDKEQ